MAKTAELTDQDRDEELEREEDSIPSRRIVPLPKRRV